MKTCDKLRKILRVNREIIRMEKISANCLISFIICLANEDTPTDYSGKLSSKRT